MTSEPIIFARGLAVGYGGQAVLTGIDLNIERGSFAGLLGANGSGKTTLLKTIAGILPAVSGEIRLARCDGRPAVIGYVPQRQSLDPLFRLSTLEVALMGACGRVPPGRRLGRAEKNWARECLRRVGAEGFERKAYDQLSGGQRQRVLIARALVAKPDILLLDEPTAGVDLAATESILTLLKELNAGGMTILMVSHDLPGVRRAARQVLWAHGGKLETGSVEEMLRPERLEKLALE